MWIAELPGYYDQITQSDVILVAMPANLGSFRMFIGSFMHSKMGWGIFISMFLPIRVSTYPPVIRDF